MSVWCCRLAWLALSLSGIACEQVSGAAELEIVAPATTSPDWSCVGTKPGPVTTGPIQYQGFVREIGSDRVLSDVSMRLCETTDFHCANPTLTTEASSDGVAFSVSASFNGYIELLSPGMLPAIIELSRPLGAMRTLPELSMIGETALNLFAAIMSASIDPAGGQLLYRAQDCGGERAEGVVVTALGELPPQARDYYIVNRKLPSTTVGQTDASGGGGFINLPATILTFEARRADNGDLISRFPARIRAGQTTFIVIEPD